MKLRKIETLNAESIFKRISEYDIYRYYLGKDFKVNHLMNSPFLGRVDDTPSFIIGNKSGSLYHFDFGDSRYNGNCFHFVSQMTGTTNFNDTLLQIDRDFNLGIVCQSKGISYKELISGFKKPENLDEKKQDTLIQVKAKKFDLSELKYWEQYYQSEQDLKDENIYSVKELYINKQKVPISPTEMVFGYLYDDKWKIYRPFETNKKKKWRTNVAIDRIDGLENIKNCEKAIITKAKKDKMVLRKIYPYVCSVQAETIVAINPENIQYLRDNSKEQYINFDSDQPGKQNSWEYTYAFGFKHINVPDEYFPTKDFADLAKERGLDFVRDYLKSKNII